MPTVHTLLSNDQALALNLIRSEACPAAFWNWLSGNFQTSLDSVVKWIDPVVANAIREILQPSMAVANAWEKQQCKNAEAWIASILGFTAYRARDLGMSIAAPILATAILPFYRSLAVGKLNESLEQGRHRMSECLVLSALAQQLGSEFAQWTERRATIGGALHPALKTAFNVDLQNVGSVARLASKHLDRESAVFDEAFLVSLTTVPDLPRQDVEWAAPEVLWRIAEELVAQKAEMVLPRPWAESAIPWTKISDHWRNLMASLQSPSGQTFRPNEITATDYNETLDAVAETDGATEEQVVSQMIDDIVAIQADFAEVVPAEEDADDDTEFPEDVPSAVRAHRPGSTDSGMIPAPKSEHLELGHSGSKVAIVEISSQKDPVFVNIMRRQIATARNDDRTVCLAAVLVEAEEGADAANIVSSRQSGLALWQEKIVQWIANNPDVSEPFAFMTSQGHLIVSMMDLERTVVTNLVRDGLIRVLTGKLDEAEVGGLSRVNVPARYYSGIGSVTAPNANFAAEQLIEATWRCLSAAQSQGKATIKSIEVF